MDAREEASLSNQRKRRPSGGGDTSTRTIQPKPVWLEFPKYDRVENLTVWLCRAEQYFEFQRMVEDKEVHLASYHMEGDA